MNTPAPIRSLVYHPVHALALLGLVLLLVACNPKAPEAAPAQPASAAPPALTQQQMTDLEAQYKGSNRVDAPAVKGWTAVQVENFKATTSDFAAQAYIDGQGNFKVSIRPSSMLGDWTGTNVASGTGQWHPEFTDAIRF